MMCKTKSISVIMIFILSLIISSRVYTQQKKETLAVLDFIVVSGLSMAEAVTLTNSFRSDLFKTNKYDVLERNEMESILSEQAFALSGACNSTECAVEIGQLLSTQKMVIGDIGKIGQSYSITLRMVDVSTGKIEKSFSERYKGETEGLLDVYKVLAQKLAGTYEEGTSLWWYLGGAALVGGGAAAYILLSEKDEEKPGKVIGTPPGEPQVP